MDAMNILSQSLSNADTYTLIILPILIFFARVIDVTLGTMRIIMVSRGRRKIAPILGFVEVFIWIVAIGQMMSHLEGINSFIGYAAGFAAGNYVGMIIEDKVALGTVMVRIFLSGGSKELIRDLTSAGFGVTSFEGHGSSGPVTEVFTTVRRKEIRHVFSIAHRVNPKAFITVEDTRTVEEGIFLPQSRPLSDTMPQRKSK
ncbi:MAG: DUF2179 domain-containing protein [Anaerolineales bacterium]|nr:DUF2179 domain-containing protein [Anaerolineales bacterium]